METIYTIGHSNRPVEEFLEILIKNNIKLVVDIRSLPGSTKYPKYNKENLIITLEKNNIKYKHISKLGGFRKNSKISPNINAFWKNKSFHNYADYAMSNDFSEGINELISLGKKYKTVIMCAEAVWWKCHRRIVTDYLLSKNIKVYHIINDIKQAIITKEAVIDKNNITYPNKN